MGFQVLCSLTQGGIQSPRARRTATTPTRGARRTVWASGTHRPGPSCWPATALEEKVGSLKWSRESTHSTNINEKAWNLQGYQTNFSLPWMLRAECRPPLSWWFVTLASDMARCGGWPVGRSIQSHSCDGTYNRTKQFQSMLYSAVTSDDFQYCAVSVWREVGFSFNQPTELCSSLVVNPILVSWKLCSNIY